MKLEPVKQSEVSHKEKNKNCILMHIYGFCKNGTDYLKVIYIYFRLGLHKEQYWLS